MNEDDEVLVAWLRKREYIIIEDNFGDMYLRKQRVTPYKSYDVRAEHMGMWIDKVVGWNAVRTLRLYPQQRGRRRPLRRLVREWVLGL